jgi:hypothetical protein
MLMPGSEGRAGDGERLQAERAAPHAHVAGPRLALAADAADELAHDRGAQRRVEHEEVRGGRQREARAVRAEGEDEHARRRPHAPRASGAAAAAGAAARRGRHLHLAAEVLLLLLRCGGAGAGAGAGRVGRRRRRIAEDDAVWRPHRLGRDEALQLGG